MFNKQQNVLNQVYQLIINLEDSYTWEAQLILPTRFVPIFSPKG